MTRFEIIVEVNGVRKYLDTDGVENISLNFNIADITEPDKRNSSYSKTIKVPETKNNRIIFGDISDLTVDSQFNPNKKSRCWILVDTIVVFEGSLQLKKISMDWRYDSYLYECVVYADNDGFFKELGELYLTDLDWSELDHVWSRENIMKSWTASWESGYFYPLIDYGYDFNLSTINQPLFVGPSGVGINPGVAINQMHPATNVKYILDKIFDFAGYSYTSEFLETREFKKLYIPYNRDGRPTRDVESLEGRFAVAVNQSGIGYPVDFNDQIMRPGVEQRYFPVYGPGQNIITTEDTEILILIQNITVPFTIETSPYGDPDGVFDTGIFKYIAPSNPPDQRFTFQFDVEMRYATILDTNLGPDYDNCSNVLDFINVNGFYDITGFQVKRSRDQNGNNVFGGLPVFVNGSNERIPITVQHIPDLELLDPVVVGLPVNFLYEWYPFPLGSPIYGGPPVPAYIETTLHKRCRGSITTDIFTDGGLNYALFPGEQIWVEFFYRSKSSILRWQIWTEQHPTLPIGQIIQLPSPYLAFGYVGPRELQFVYDQNDFVLAAIETRTNILEYTLPNGTYVGWGTRLSEDFDLITFRPKNIFFNNLSPYLTSGEIVPYNQRIPLNVKLKDFVSSLAKLFNLYIEPQKDNLKNLIIDPRDIYYGNSSIIKDWTYKLDTNSNINEQILAESQNRTILFTYKADKDFYNEDYTSRKAGDIYGQYELEIDNDFSKGVRKIEPIFSPTPLVPMTGTDKIIIPKIGKLNNGIFGNTDHNIRILTRYSRKSDKTWNFDYYGRSTNPSFLNLVFLSTAGISNIAHTFVVGDLIQVSLSDGGVSFPQLQGLIAPVISTSTFEIIIDLYRFTPIGVTVSGTVITIDGLQPITDVSWRFDTQKVQYIPYLGHFDDPINSRYDLNFGQSTTYFPYETLTNNNLFNLYYKNQFDEITSKDSRIITAQFYLNAADIADFKFSDTIFIDDQYYKVNKINNYDPTKNGLTTVELIKSGLENVTIKRISDTAPTNNPIEVPGDAIDIVERGQQPFLTALSNNTNTIKRPNSIVGGSDNTVYGEAVLIVGNDNRVSSNDNFILGSNNAINFSSNGVLVVGDSNNVASGVQNSIIFGSNTSVVNSNTLQINQKFIVTSNFISAGRDEVLNMYFDNKPINYISASFDMVREFGSQDPVNYITSGRDQI